jgi:hypothetical protein
MPQAGRKGRAAATADSAADTREKRMFYVFGLRESGTSLFLR